MSEETRKVLGKIKSVNFGFGGYENSMFGCTFLLGDESSSVYDFWGTWANDPGEHAQWTKQEQREFFADLIFKIIVIMKDAKVKYFSELKDMPVEITYTGNRLQSWRILTEVI